MEDSMVCYAIRRFKAAYYEKTSWIQARNTNFYWRLLNLERNISERKIEEMRIRSVFFGRFELKEKPCVCKDGSLNSTGSSRPQEPKDGDWRRGRRLSIVGARDAFSFRKDRSRMGTRGFSDTNLQRATGGYEMFHPRQYMKFPNGESAMIPENPHYLFKDRRREYDKQYDPPRYPPLQIPSYGHSLQCRCSFECLERGVTSLGREDFENYYPVSSTYGDAGLGTSRMRIPDVPGKKRKLGKMESRCTHCGTTETSLWRRLENKVVCNACGLYHKMHGVRRPISLKKPVIRKRRRSRRVFEEDTP